MYWEKRQIVIVCGSRNSLLIHSLNNTALCTCGTISPFVFTNGILLHWFPLTVLWNRLGLFFNIFEIVLVKKFNLYDFKLIWQLAFAAFKLPSRKRSEMP